MASRNLPLGGEETSIARRMKSQALSLVTATLAGVCAYGSGILLSQPLGRLAASIGIGPAARRQGAVSPTDEPRVASPGQGIAGDAVDGGTVAGAGPTNAYEAVVAKLRQYRRGQSGSWESMGVLVGTLSTNDYPKVWAMLDAVPRNVRIVMQPVLSCFWARTDPSAALAAALAVPQDQRRQWSNMDRSRLLEGIFSTWGERDPVTALAAARQMPAGLDRNDALQCLISGVASRDPVAAVPLLTNLPPDDYAQAAAEVIRRIAPLDPDAATALLNEVRELRPPSDNDNGEAQTASEGADTQADLANSHQRMMRSGCLSAIADARASRGVEQAIDWAQALAGLEDREAALRAVIERLVKDNPDKAAELVRSQADAKLRGALATALVSRWAWEEPQAASAWILQLTNGPMRKQALSDLEYSWSNKDPEAAANFLITALPAGEERTALLSKLPRQWLFHGEAAEHLVEWARSLPDGPDRDAFLGGVSRGQSDESPEDAARTVLLISPGKEQTKAFDDLAMSWVEKDAPGAAAWCAALPPGPARAEASASIIKFWCRNSPTAAGQWLASLPDDDTRAPAAGAYVSLVAQSHPDLAAQFVGSIRDEAKRNEQIEIIAREWSKTNPDAARAIMLQRSGLPSP